MVRQWEDAVESRDLSHPVVSSLDDLPTACRATNDLLKPVHQPLHGLRYYAGRWSEVLIDDFRQFLPSYDLLFSHSSLILSLSYDQVSFKCFCLAVGSLLINSPLRSLSTKRQKKVRKRKKNFEDRLQVLECPKLWRWMVGTQNCLAPPFDSSIISIDFFVESC